VPGVGPGPSGGSGPAHFMMQQQQYQQQQQQPRLGIPGVGPGPSGGSGSGYATLGYGLGSAVYPGPPLRQSAGAAGQQQRPPHFQGPASEGLAYPPGSAGPMSMSNSYGQQVHLSALAASPGVSLAFRLVWMLCTHAAEIPRATLGSRRRPKNRQVLADELSRSTDISLSQLSLS